MCAACGSVQAPVCGALLLPPLLRCQRIQLNHKLPCRQLGSFIYLCRFGRDGMLLGAFQLRHRSAACSPAVGCSRVVAIAPASSCPPSFQSSRRAPMLTTRPAPRP
eukprot:2589799-Prymnesium_polylepis.1